MARQIDREARSGFSYNASTGYNQIVGITEYDYMLLTNPTASGKELLFTHMNGDVDSSTSRCIFRLYSMPTITTNGTAITAVNGLIKASPPTEITKIYKDPTISARGGLLAIKKISPNAGSFGQNRSFWVEANSSLLVTVENSVANTKTFVQLYWVEI